MGNVLPLWPVSREYWYLQTTLGHAVYCNGQEEKSALCSPQPTYCNWTSSWLCNTKQKTTQEFRPTQTLYSVFMLWKPIVSLWIFFLCANHDTKYAINSISWKDVFDKITAFSRNQKLESFNISPLFCLTALCHWRDGAFSCKMSL